ncbi:MAG TPA: hypothetical protein VG268_01830 [Streptosporangiaceae bacterium]|nr:hypothetical protein [Streptosporangiaceae bacterium]
MDRLSAAGLVRRAAREGRSVHLAVTPAVQRLTAGLTDGQEAQLTELLSLTLSTPDRPRAEAAVMRWRW